MASYLKSISVCIALTIFFLIPSDLNAARGVDLTKKEDLSHTSGNLGTYEALVIGINNYQDSTIPPLKTAVNDAKEFANLLKTKYGFKVTLLLDNQATKKAVYQKLRELAADSSSDESVLIYYAGHGEIDRVLNDGWWVPVDAKAGDSETYLDNTVVQKVMNSMKARHVLLISDSCYSGTLFGESRSLPPLIDERYYLNLYNEKSRWGITSGNKTPVSDSGSANHSIFAYHLIKALQKNEKPFITTQEICSQIAPIIANNSEQQPLCSPIRGTGDQGGGFVFVSSSVAPLYSDKGGNINASRMKEQLEAEQQDSDRINQLELERKKIESEKKNLQEERALLEQQKYLAEERRRLESERLSLAAIQKRAEDSIIGTWFRSNGQRAYKIYREGDVGTKYQFTGQCIRGDSPWLNLKQLKLNRVSSDKYIGTSLWFENGTFKEGPLEVQIVNEGSIRYITTSPFTGERIDELWSKQE